MTLLGNNQPSLEWRISNKSTYLSQWINGMEKYFTECVGLKLNWVKETLKDIKM
jgi:hypothetical protein